MKKPVTQFDLAAAFKALDEIDYETVESNPVKNSKRLNESLLKETCKRITGRKLNIERLVEDYYDLDDEQDLNQAAEDREAEIAQAKLSRIEKIVDLDAKTADDLLSSYVGKVIIRCPQCMNMFYKNEEDIVRDEEDPTTCNVNEPCQHCGNISGYEIIGKVDKLSPEDTAQLSGDEEVPAEGEEDLDLDLDTTEEEAPAEEGEATEEAPEESTDEDLDLDLDLDLEEPAQESLNASKAAKSDFASKNETENKTLNESKAWKNDLEFCQMINDGKVKPNPYGLGYIRLGELSQLCVDNHLDYAHNVIEQAISKLTEKGGKCAEALTEANKYGRSDDEDYYAQDINDAVMQLKKTGHAEFWCRQGKAKADQVVKTFEDRYGKKAEYTIDDDYCTARVIKSKKESIKESLDTDLLNELVDKIPDDICMDLNVDTNPLYGEGQGVIGDILFDFNFEEDTIAKATELVNAVLSNLDTARYSYQIWNPSVLSTEECQSIDEVVKATTEQDEVDLLDEEGYLQISIYENNSAVDESLKEGALDDFAQNLSAPTKSASTSGKAGKTLDQFAQNLGTATRNSTNKGATNSTLDKFAQSLDDDTLTTPNKQATVGTSKAGKTLDQFAQHVKEGAEEPLKESSASQILAAFEASLSDDNFDAPVEESVNKAEVEANTVPENASENKSINEENYNYSKADIEAQITKLKELIAKEQGDKETAQKELEHANDEFLGKDEQAAQKAQATIKAKTDLINKYNQKITYWQNAINNHQYTESKDLNEAVAITIGVNEVDDEVVANSPADAMIVAEPNAVAVYDQPEFPEIKVEPQEVENPFDQDFETPAEFAGEPEEIDDEIEDEPVDDEEESDEEENEEVEESLQEGVLGTVKNAVKNAGGAFKNTFISDKLAKGFDRFCVRAKSKDARFFERAVDYSTYGEAKQGAIFASRKRSWADYEAVIMAAPKTAAKIGPRYTVIDEYANGKQTDKGKAELKQALDAASGKTTTQPDITQSTAPQKSKNGLANRDAVLNKFNQELADDYVDESLQEGIFDNIKNKASQVKSTIKGKSVDDGFDKWKVVSTANDGKSTVKDCTSYAEARNYAIALSKQMSIKQAIIKATDTTGVETAIDGYIKGKQPLTAKNLFKKAKLAAQGAPTLGNNLDLDNSNQESTPEGKPEGKPEAKPEGKPEGKPEPKPTRDALVAALKDAGYKNPKTIQGIVNALAAKNLVTEAVEGGALNEDLASATDKAVAALQALTDQAMSTIGMSDEEPREELLADNANDAKDATGAETIDDKYQSTGFGDETPNTETSEIDEAAGKPLSRTAKTPAQARQARRTAKTNSMAKTTNKAEYQKRVKAAVDNFANSLADDTDGTDAVYTNYSIWVDNNGQCTNEVGENHVEINKALDSILAYINNLAPEDKAKVGLSWIELAADGIEGDIVVSVYDPSEGEATRTLSNYQDYESKILDALNEGVNENLQEDVSDAEYEQMLNSKVFQDFNEEINIDNIDEIDEESVNECTTNYLKEVYSNVDRFELTRADVTNGVLVLEGLIRFHSGKTRNTTFGYNLTTGKHLAFSGVNEDLAKNGQFNIQCSLNNKSLVVESLAYSHEVNGQLVEGLVHKN